jgi:hypothetical protein
VVSELDSSSACRRSRRVPQKKSLQHYTCRAEPSQCGTVPRLGGGGREEAAVVCDVRTRSSAFLVLDGWVGGLQNATKTKQNAVQSECSNFKKAYPPFAPDSTVSSNPGNLLSSLWNQCGYLML